MFRFKRPEQQFVKHIRLSFSFKPLVFGAPRLPWVIWFGYIWLEWLVRSFENKQINIGIGYENKHPSKLLVFGSSNEWFISQKEETYLCPVFEIALRIMTAKYLWKNIAQLKEFPNNLPLVCSLSSYQGTRWFRGCTGIEWNGWIWSNSSFWCNLIQWRVCITSTTNSSNKYTFLSRCLWQNTTSRMWASGQAWSACFASLSYRHSVNRFQRHLWMHPFACRWCFGSFLFFLLTLHLLRQHAALKGHALICKELLTHGAQVDAIALDGWTPLLKAANGGHAKVVKLLMQHGANPNTRTAPGSTPQANLTAYEIAQQQGCFHPHIEPSRWSLFFFIQGFEDVIQAIETASSDAEVEATSAHSESRIIKATSSESKKREAGTSKHLENPEYGNIDSSKNSLGSSRRSSNLSNENIKPQQSGAVHLLEQSCNNLNCVNLQICMVCFH